MNTKIVFSFFGLFLALIFLPSTQADALSLSSVINRLERYRGVQSALNASAIDAISPSSQSSQTQEQVVSEVTKKPVLPPNVHKRVFGELKSASPSGRVITKTIKYGTKNSDEVKKLQVFLIAKGYLTSEPTGVFGKQTRDALRKFQMEKGIKGDGTIVGPATQSAIETEIATNAEENIE